MGKTFSLGELASLVNQPRNNLIKKWADLGIIKDIPFKECRKAGMKLIFRLLPDQSEG